MLTLIVYVCLNTIVTEFGYQDDGCRCYYWESKVLIVLVVAINMNQCNFLYVLTRNQMC